MLSRISVLAHKSAKYQVLKLASSQARSMQLVTLRSFTAGTQPPSSDASQSAEGAKQSTPATSQDDYNLDEVAATQTSSQASDGSSTSAKASNPDRKDRRSPQQPYQKREGTTQSNGGMNLKQKRQAEEAVPEKQITFEDYKMTKNFQLQQEIFNLIRNKIGSSNKDKVQRFYTKLQEELKSKVSMGAVQRIDDLTIRKIQALILEQKTLDDKTLFEDYVKGTGTAKPSQFLTQNLFPTIENEYFPLRYDIGDTQKLSPMSWEQYEALAEERENDIIRDELIDDPKKTITAAESGVDEDEGSAAQEVESKEDNENYALMMQGIREQFFKTLPTAEERTIFDFDRVSNEVHGFKSKMELEEEERKRQIGTFYAEHDVDLLTPEYMDRHMAAFKTDKEIEDEFEETWAGLTSDIYSTLRDDLKSHYDQARLLMKLNQQLRMKILYSVKTSKTLLSQTQKQKERLVQRLESHARDFQSDVIPKRVFDFIGHEKQLANKSHLRQNKKKLVKQYLERQFDHNTTSIEQFNNELSILVNHFKLVSDDKKISKDLIAQMTYIVELLHKNQAPKNIITKARLFEFGVISRNNEFANQQLKQIASEDKQHQFSIVDPDLLNQFFSQSLKSNNFNGLGHLMTYLEKYGIDISGWNINSFKGPLEFNLNQQFNLGNVLVFTKYYTHYHTCRLGKELKLLDKPISELSDAEKFALNNKVFNAPSLVDMRTLFGYLVQNLGTKQVVDPVSKEDALWRIVDFFTQKGINQIASFGETSFNTLSDNDISQYLSNRLNDTKALDKLTQTLLRLGENEAVHNNVLQSLKEYTANNNSQLPDSFEVSKIRNAYLRLKSLNTQKKATFTEKNIEYFLYLFRQQKMWAELIDACESFPVLTGSSSKSNEIVRYYLSDTLLQLPADKHYYDLVQSAVFDGKDDLSANYVTAMTKAHLKDGSVDHALKFFESQIAKLRDIRVKREDVLIALFDSAYAEVNQADANITFDEFKNRYLDILTLSNDLIRESYAVSTMSRVLKDKHYDEIDTLFQLSLVAKQENQLLSQIPAHLISGTEQSVGLSDEALSYLNEKQLTDLKDLNDRRLVLQSKLHERDVQRLTEYLNYTKEKKIALLDDLEDTTADKIQQIFNIRSKDEVDVVLQRTERFSGAIKSLRDNSSDSLNLVWQKSEQAMARALKKSMKEINTLREVPDKSIEQIIEQTYKRKNVNPIEEYEQNEQELTAFHDYMLNDEIYDAHDPFIIKAQAHDQTLADMRDELLQAINSRKGKVLASALKIFNKVQDQHLKSVKLSTVEGLELDNIVDGSQVSESLQKFNIIFNDPRSPVYSAVQTLAQYKGDKGVFGFNKLYRDLEDFVKHRIDLDHIQKERDQLEALSNELQKSQLQIKALNSYILKEQQEINKEVVLKDSVFAQWKSGKDRTLASSLEKRISSMYNDFKAKGKPAEEFSREDKLALMKDVFSLEFGHGEFASSQQVFPSFYCQDLIIFGIENNIAEAVRLGEKMMSENNYTLSIEMQKALKEFLLNNTEQYQQAMKRTGPIDNTTLYKRVQNQNKDEVPIMMNLDDPYWQDFIARNSARTQQWRIPSHLAWDHKQYGIAGEVVDFKRVRETQNQFKKYF